MSSQLTDGRSHMYHYNSHNSSQCQSRVHRTPVRPYSVQDIDSYRKFAAWVLPRELIHPGVFPPLLLPPATAMEKQMSPMGATAECYSTGPQWSTTGPLGLCVAHSLKRKLDWPPELVVVVPTGSQCMLVADGPNLYSLGRSLKRKLDERPVLPSCRTLSDPSCRTLSDPLFLVAHSPVCLPSDADLSLHSEVAASLNIQESM